MDHNSLELKIRSPENAGGRDAMDNNEDEERDLNRERDSFKCKLHGHQ